MIKVGDTLPHTTLMEYSDVEGEGCSIGPNAVDVAKATAGKTIALFALPGAFTPTCSAKHVPGYVEHYEQFKAAGVDEALLRKAADTGASGDLKAALNALDAGLAKAGGDRKAVIRGLLEISSGLYKGVVVDGGVDPIEYQHALGAALSARAALLDAAKSDPSLAAAKPEMDRFVALWPTPSAPEKPAAHGALLAQASRIELALS